MTQQLAEQLTIQVGDTCNLEPGHPFPTLVFRPSRQPALSLEHKGPAGYATEANKKGLCFTRRCANTFHSNPILRHIKHSAAIEGIALVVNIQRICDPSPRRPPQRLSGISSLVKSHVGIKFVGRDEPCLDQFPEKLAKAGRGEPVFLHEFKCSNPGSDIAYYLDGSYSMPRFHDFPQFRVASFS